MSTLIHDLETQIAAAPSRRAKMDALNALALHVSRHDPERCIKLSEEVLALSEADDVLRKAASFNTAGFAHFILRNLDKARSCCIKAIELFENAAQLEGQPKAYATLGLTYQEIGDFVTAHKMYLQQLEIARQLEDQWYIAYALQRIGALYDLIGDYDDTLAYYAQSLAAYQAIADLNGQAAIYNNLSVTYQKLEDFTYALEHAQTALRLFIKTDNPYGQARIHANLAEIYARLGNADKAFEHAKQSLEMAIDSDRKEPQAIGWLTLATVYNIMEHAEQAIESLRESLRIAKEIKSIHLQYQCHEQLSKAYELQGHYAWALHHYERFHVLKKQALDEENRAKLYQLEVYYQTQQAHKETERLKSLREQEQAHHERINRLKDELIYTTSHDLRNPLSNIIGLAELNLELDDLNTESTRQDLHNIIQQAEIMIELIGDVLDLARLETDQDLKHRPIILETLIHQTELAYQSQAERKNITLSFKNNHGVQTKIMADEIGLRRVLGNLVSNAIKYTPDGGQVLLELEADDTATIIRVTDSGFGIGEGDLPHIFERFYRVTNAPHHQVEGTGLGLAIAKLIVEQHGGQIEVSSQLSEGSTFTVCLPPCSNEALSN
jgi:signal transduction histidine kinase